MWSRLLGTLKCPEKPLDDRVKSCVQYGTITGPDTVLMPEEERGLKECLLFTAERGFPLSKKMALAFAWAIVNKETDPGIHWWRKLELVT